MMAVFVGLNGHEIEAEEVEVVTKMVGVASGAVGEENLAGWLREHLVVLGAIEV